MAGNWYRSSPVLVSIISVFQSFFSKSEPQVPQELPDIHDQKVLDLGDVSRSSLLCPSCAREKNSINCQPPSSPPPPSPLISDTSAGHETSASPSPAAQSGKSQKMNPIVKVLRDQELGKTLLTYVIPISTAVLTVNCIKHASLPLPSIVVSLCIGLPALWIGILFRAILPDTISNGIEQFGACSIFFAFFSVVSSLLPPDLVWIPWTCFSVTLLLSILSCLPGAWFQLIENPDDAP